MKRGDLRPLWIGAMLAIAALLCVRPAAAQTGIVPVTGGRLEGVTADGVTSFKGIPFAAPPVGDLRWRAPQPVLPWNGVKQADHFAPACMQDPVVDPVVGKPVGAPRTLSDSEDCLYLNVWTPARSASKKLPVMVWIYGGGFTIGMTSTPMYDGTHLARKGVVLVSVAYRLGALGLLVDSELSAESPHHVSGNYSLLDVIAALRWVRGNIGKFGGDPARVTIFGQSAGASVVGLLAASPLAKGLFQRAIAESGVMGGGGGPVPFDGLPAEQATGDRFLAKLGARDIAAARALPAEVIVKAQPGLTGGPVDDRYVLPGDEYELYRAGRFSDTALLLGTNSDEGRLRGDLNALGLGQRALLGTNFDEGRLHGPPGVTPARFEAQIRAQYGAYASPILALYPHATDVEAEQAARDVFRDSFFGWDTWTWALLHSQKGTDKVFLYYFDRRSPQGPLGPTHGAEMGYVFGNLVSPVSGWPGLRWPSLRGTPGPADVTLSQQIQGYWVNFAKTGDPNGPALPHWPAFSASSQRVMYLDAHPHVGPVPNMKQIRALDAYYANVRRREEAKKKRAN